LETVVPLDEARDVLLLCSAATERFHFQTYVEELAFALEFAARGRSFAVTDDPSTLFDKNVTWFLPGKFVRPRLWDYSRQAYEFAAGLERQGNRAFCSAEETLFWENKAHMHRRFAEIGVPTPHTVIVNAENCKEVNFDVEPVVVKQEHSAGSAGIRYFSTGHEARRFVMSYPFRPTESLIVQEVVTGATRDLRLTMAGAHSISGASYWREKSAAAVASPTWTPTATKYGSTVNHGDIPESAVSLTAGYIRQLGLRTAGLDLIWVEDDLTRDPLILELSPYYQPNPPKPARHADWSYQQYKERRYVKEGYLTGQFQVFRTIAAELMEQGLV
jgi:glutathione synthase/RimK-type ligase-like ATP-grasp enzyme